MMKKLLLTLMLLPINFIFGQNPITISSNCGDSNAQGVYNYVGGVLRQYQKLGDCSSLTNETDCSNSNIYSYRLFWSNNQWNWEKYINQGNCLWLIEECVPAAQRLSAPQKSATGELLLATNTADTPTPPCTGWVVQASGFCEPTFSECTNLSTMENLLASDITLYPNPTTGKVNIKLEKQHDIVNISLYTISGQQVFQKDFKNTSLIQFDVEQPSGAYLVKLIDSSKKESWIKLIKK